MERTPAQRKHRRQQLRRKYKRYAAAVAGAAILTGAVLPGIPAAKALAADRPTNLSPLKTVQTTALEKDSRTTVTQAVAEKVQLVKRHRLKRGWHEHNNSWPGPDENQIRYEDGRVYYRSDNNRDRDYVNYLSSPVDFVKDRAAMYGFDRYRDAFTLLSLSGNQAVVQVTKHDNGSLFNILLERDHDSNWKIADIRAR
ncbi:MAG: hypothetical protein RIN56_07420 [Sporomusaceae bacterium]|nr:hypothetical protein [Sporomusaceae bacterium]